MQKLRIIGPRERLDAALQVLQDLGTLHVSRPALSPPLGQASATERQLRHERVIRGALEDIDETLSRLGVAARRHDVRPATPVERISQEVRLARRARRAALGLIGELRAVETERDTLAHLTELLEVFAELESRARVQARVQDQGQAQLQAQGQGRHDAFLVLERDQANGLAAIEAALREAMGNAFRVHTQPVPGGELAVMLEVPTQQAGRLAALLPEAGVGEIELPAELDRGGPRAAAHEVRRRLAAADEKRALLEERRQRLAAWMQPGLLRARAALNDWLIKSAARQQAAVTRHLFVVEGWLPADARDALTHAFATRIGPSIVIEEVAKELWTSPDAPVSIRNPPLLRPFEVITRRLPAPRYGTLDPTPFVAVFFPIFFGLMLGDVGYGAMLAALAALGWRRSQPGSTWRAVSQIAVACAIFSVLFGLFFGELFGDLGHRLFGLQAMSFSREDTVVPFLILSVSIGFVHVVLGLVLGAISGMRSTPRKSLGRGLMALMLVLTAAVLLAAVNVLPEFFLEPSVVALLLSFPVLILLEGFLGPVELLSRVSNILSYARIMALGTASVMLAVVANEMVGALGGAAVGVVFATLFHLVNFGLGVFSPTIHALRLHFVEFFGTFYSPGDQVYQPLRHWCPSDGAAPKST